MHAHVPVWGQYFTLPVTKLTAHHLCVRVCPAVITHCPPLTIVEDFYTSLIAPCTPYQPNSAVWREEERQPVS